MVYILLMYLGTQCDAEFWFYCVCGVALTVKFILDCVKLIRD